MPTPPATTSSTSSSAPGTCASRPWPCTIFARSLASTAPRGLRRQPPDRAGHALSPSHAPPQRCRRTSPCHLLHRQDAMVSFDEHTIPRWTKKFHIGKGYSTTRNKYMRCEKLFTGYDLVSGRFLSVRATPGNTSLQDLAVPLLQQVLRQGRPR